MRRTSEYQSVVVSVYARKGRVQVKGRGRGWSVYDVEPEQVVALVDAALDLDPNTLWGLVQHGAPLADTPENRAYLWERFLSRAFAEPPNEASP